MPLEVGWRHQASMSNNFDRAKATEAVSASPDSEAVSMALDNVFAELAGVSITRRSNNREAGTKTLEFAPGFDMAKSIDFSQAYVPNWMSKDGV